MAFDRVAEVEALLAQDDAREGRLWRWYRDGRTDAEWKVAHDVATAPTNAKHTIEALLHGVVPRGPSYAAVDAGTVRRWLATKALSAQLDEALRAQLRLLEQIAAGPRKVGLSRRTSEQLEASRKAEVQRIPGVYVYGLPHYLKHHVDDESGRTLLKVGHSSVDVFDRIAHQRRMTALPEDPVLLRIYPSQSSAKAEATFHHWLKQAGHLRPASTLQAGNEWFLTSLSFLDDVATQIGLNVRVINHESVHRIAELHDHAHLTDVPAPVLATAPPESERPGLA